MTDAPAGRVAVYLDFDNIVTARYDSLHGVGSFRTDKIRHMNPGWSSTSPERVARATAAGINLGAIHDFASTLGNVAIARAYADWSVPINDSYSKPLNKMSITPVHLSAISGNQKNAADIRLTIDVIEDVLGSAELSHVIIVAGDSDYVPLVRRCRELGKIVVGIGVEGSVSEYLRDACDLFVPYETLPGVATRAAHSARVAPTAASTTPPPKASTAQAPNKSTPKVAAPVVKPATAKATSPATAAQQRAATALLLSSLPKAEAGGHGAWIPCSALKNGMLNADRSFNEKTLGYKTFSAFVESRGGQVEYSSTANGRARIRAGALT